MTDVPMEKQFLTVGEHTITRTPEGDYWIGDEGGEGMQTPRAKFEQLIKDYYLAEF